MQYKTELHAHTNEVSPCADFTAPELAERYIEAGYSSFVLTNHFSSKLLARGGKDWERQIDFFTAPYHHMKEYAAGRLNVILGCELRFDANDNDYLLFGLTEAFLRKYPDMQKMKMKEFSLIARQNGVLIIQAHPFRNGMKIADPDLVDGYEGFNAHPGHAARNHLAVEWARMHGKLITSGSDFHHPTSVTAGGILTDVPVTDTLQLAEILRTGACTLLCGGPAAERDGMRDMPAKY